MAFSRALELMGEFWYLFLIVFLLGAIVGRKF